MQPRRWASATEVAVVGPPPGSVARWWQQWTRELCKGSKAKLPFNQTTAVEWLRAHNLAAGPHPPAKTSLCHAAVGAGVYWRHQSREIYWACSSQVQLCMTVRVWHPPAGRAPRVALAAVVAVAGGVAVVGVLPAVLPPDAAAAALVLAQHAAAVVVRLVPPLAAAVHAVVLLLVPQPAAPAAPLPPRVLPCVAEWLVHSRHSMTAAETRHQAGRQQGPGEGGGCSCGGAVQLWWGAEWWCQGQCSM